MGSRGAATARALKWEKYEGIEFVGLPALSEATQAYLRKRYGHRANPFSKKPATMYLPRKVHTALQRRLKEIDRGGGYTPAYRLLAAAADLNIR